MSAHIHFGTGSIYGPECDRVLVDVVKPVAEECLERGWADQYFFVRYRESGSHVRFRLTGACRALEESARPALECAVAADSCLSLQWVPYKPETERYGGEASMPLAESAFCASSRMVIASLDYTGSLPSDVRLGRALMAMTALIHAFTGSHAQALELLAAYSAGYRGVVAGGDEGPLVAAFEAAKSSQPALADYVDEVWRRLSTGEPTMPALDVYHLEMRQIRDAFRDLYDCGRLQFGASRGPSWNACVAALLPSLLHMTNNRFGVSMSEEAYLGHLGAAAFSARGSTWV